MKAMESKLVDTRHEMDTLDMLHEIRTLNARNANVDPLDLIDHLGDHEGTMPLEEDEEQAIREMILARKMSKTKMLEDEEEDVKTLPRNVASTTTTTRNSKSNNNTHDTTTTNNKNNNDNNNLNTTTTTSNIAATQPKEKKSKIGIGGLKIASHPKIQMKFEAQSRDKLVVYPKMEMGEASGSGDDGEDMGAGLVNY